MMLKLEQYFEYLRTVGNTSPITIRNYQNAIQYVGISEIESENLNPIWKQLLTKFDSGTSYGYIQNILKIIRSLLKVHGIAFTRDYDYNTLVAKLGKAGTVPEEYTTEQVQKILFAVQGEDLDLFSLCVLCSFAGLRISAAKGLRFADFEKVHSIDVYTFHVRSKCRDYTAVISQKGYEALRAANYPESEFVVRYDGKLASTFDIIYRKKLTDALTKKGLINVLENRKPFHSMRKFFAQRLSEAGLNAEDVGLLMGHAPNTTAYRHYVDKNELKERIAKAYAKTALYSMEVV